MVSIVGVATKIVCNYCEARVLIDDNVSMGAQLRFHGWSAVRRDGGGVECSCPPCASNQLVLATMLGLVAAGADR